MYVICSLESHGSSYLQYETILRRPGNRGYFPLDLWTVLLRIIGFDARRRGNTVQQSAANLMIV